MHPTTKVDVEIPECAVNRQIHPLNPGRSTSRTEYQIRPGSNPVAACWPIPVLHLAAEEPCSAHGI
eukprot:5961678-Pleurochrysis_carterae.AAC.1